MGEQRRPGRSVDVLSLGSFVLLGLPDGMLGTAWPSMRATFGAPVGALGLILLVATAGSVLVTAFVGPLIRRLGVPALLAMAGVLHLSAGATGLAAFGYWGALTAVRIGLALLPRPIPPQAVVRWGSGIAVLAAATIWWRPDVAVAVIGFVVLGGSLAGVFPALIALTPVRLGEQRAHNVISWQVGSAAAGGAGLSAVIGLLVGATSLAALGPAVTVLALIVVAFELALNRLAPAT